MKSATTPSDDIFELLYWPIPEFALPFHHLQLGVPHAARALIEAYSDYRLKSESNR
jgi:hypothetical protein